MFGVGPSVRVCCYEMSMTVFGVERKSYYTSAHNYIIIIMFQVCIEQSVVIIIYIFTVHPD